jgi:hypothetical protein
LLRYPGLPFSGIFFPGFSLGEAVFLYCICTERLVMQVEGTGADRK